MIITIETNKKYFFYISSLRSKQIMSCKLFFHILGKVKSSKIQHFFRARPGGDWQGLGAAAPGPGPSRPVPDPLKNAGFLNF